MAEIGVGDEGMGTKTDGRSLVDIRKGRAGALSLVVKTRVCAAD